MNGKKEKEKDLKRIWQENKFYKSDVFYIKYHLIFIEKILAESLYRKVLS